MEIVPAIDILDGKCVRLTKGDYDTKKIYSEDPLEIARMFESHGIHRLHLVDLDGARNSHIINHQVLRRIASQTGLKVDFGGGVKTDQDLAIAFENGASMVTIGSAAVKHPERLERWLHLYGPSRIILGADVRNGNISVNGWKEDSPLGLTEFLRDYTAKGVRQVLCTDINRDGMLQGPAVDLYRSILQEFPAMHLIASGGVSSMQDLTELKKAGLPAAIVGKAFYEGHITLEQLASFCYDQAADNTELVD